MPHCLKSRVMAHFPCKFVSFCFFRSLPASDGDSTGSLTKPLNLVILGSEGLASDFITETRVSIYNRVPTSSGNHGKHGKSLKIIPCMENSE